MLRRIKTDECHPISDTLRLHLREKQAQRRARAIYGAAAAHGVKSAAKPDAMKRRERTETRC